MVIYRPILVRVIEIRCDAAALGREIWENGVKDWRRDGVFFHAVSDESGPRAAIMLGYTWVVGKGGHRRKGRGQQRLERWSNYSGRRELL